MENCMLHIRYHRFNKFLVYAYQIQQTLFIFIKKQQQTVYICITQIMTLTVAGWAVFHFIVWKLIQRNCCNFLKYLYTK